MPRGNSWVRGAVRVVPEDLRKQSSLENTPLCPNLHHRPDRRAGRSVARSDRCRLREGLQGTGIIGHTKRLDLERVLVYVRQGDTLVVTQLDRLARSMVNLVDITGKLKAKGVDLRVLALSLDTGTPHG